MVSFLVDLGKYFKRCLFSEPIMVDGSVIWCLSGSDVQGEEGWEIQFFGAVRIRERPNY